MEAVPHPSVQGSTETPITDSFYVASSAPLLPMSTLSHCLPRKSPVGSYVAALDPLTTLRSVLEPQSPGNFPAW